MKALVLGAALAMSFSSYAAAQCPDASAKSCRCSRTCGTSERVALSGRDSLVFQRGSSSYMITDRYVLARAEGILRALPDADDAAASKADSRIFSLVEEAYGRGLARRVS